MRTFDLMTALAVGIGTTRLVETVKETVPVIPPSHYKSAFASAVAGTAGAVLTDGSWQARVLTAVGSAGVAMIAHEVVALMSTVNDRNKTHVIRAAQARS